MQRTASVTFCYDHFWNTSNWNASTLNFSECFQYVTFAVPSASFLVLTPVYLWWQMKRKPVPVTNISLNGCNYFSQVLVFFTFIAIVSTICCKVFRDYVSKQPTFDMLHYVSLSACLISLVVSAFFNERQRRLHQPRSQLMFCFLLLLFSCGLPRLYHLALRWTRQNDTRRNSQVSATIERMELCSMVALECLVLLQLLIQCFSPHNKRNSRLTDENACPELWASVPSLWTFSWLTGTIWQAFRGGITSSDVFTVRPVDGVTVNHARFKQAWEKCTLRLSTEKDSDSTSVRSRSKSSESRQPLLASSSDTTLSVAQNDMHNESLLEEQQSGTSTAAIPAVVFSSSVSRQKHIGDENVDTSGSGSSTFSFALIRTLCVAFGSRLLVAWLCLLVATLLNYASPIMLSLLLRFISNADVPTWVGYCIAVAMFIFGLVTTIVDQRGFYHCLSLSVAVRSALTSAVYRKSMRLSAESRSHYTSGALVNLLSVDVDRVREFFMYSFFVWRAVIQFVLSFVLLWRQLGLATLAGIGFMVLMLPLNMVIMWYTKKFETMEMEWKDSRLKCLGEVFGAIKILKLYAWEKAFQKKLDGIRHEELRRLAHAQFGWSIDIVMWNLTPYVILLVTFLTYTREFVFYNHSVSVTNSTASIPQLLDPERIFVSLSLFNLMRTPLILLPWSMSVMIMAYVSIKRIALFLLSSELDKNAVTPFASIDSNLAIEFVDASFSWTQDGPIVLHNLNLAIPRGSLVAIVGAVGTGKSSLLSSCMGDMVKRGGMLHLNGSIAYVPQTAWIQQQTLQKNVCFGESLDSALSTSSTATLLTADESKRVWYEAVLSACALCVDIDHLPAGDETEIGERGVNLSGGQRQRVSLARAVYQLSDIYLLDDPLSAVDSQVRQHLFDNVLGPRGLLREKTRLLVTNSFHYLNQVDWLIVLTDDGHVAQSGTYQDILDNTQGHFAQYLRALEQRVVAHTKKHKTQNDITGALSDVQHYHHSKENQLVALSSFCDTSENILRPSRRSSIRASIHADILLPRIASHTTTLSRNQSTETPEHNTTGLSLSVLDHGWCAAESDTESDDMKSSICTKSVSDRFIDEEELSQGRVPWSVFVFYLRARGWTLCTFTILTYILSLSVQTFANWWLQWFADDADLIAASSALNNDTIFHNDTARAQLISAIASRTYYYVTGYALAGVGLCVLTLIFVICHWISSLRASKLLHQLLLARILRAPAMFFDCTPLGRILNRFSNDVHQLDHNIPDACMDVVSCFGDTVVTLFIVVIALRPVGLGLAIVIPIVILCCAILVLYMPCSRQARRLDAITRSPLLSFFSESGASSLGAAVVRAFGRTDTFVATADRLIDRNAVMLFLLYASNRWLDVCLNIITRCFLFVVILVMVSQRGLMSGGLAGLIITYTVETAENFTWFVKQLVQLETSAVSLERIREYTSVPQEYSWEEGPDSPPPPNWPGPCCQVVFNKATVVYNRLQSIDAIPLVDEENATIALRSVDLALSGDFTRRRIGIVGRTGAGKSTLASCIFRLVEPCIFELDRCQITGDLADRGPILVDGVDLSRLGLHEIRSRFSILPQEPVLFSGSLRFNLDPFGTRSDQELLAALHDAHLTEWMQYGAFTLDYECGEGGCNLSAGQRQLVCLARVFLSSSGRVRLLILDEATAAMDPATDQLVMQTVIGNQFKDATVLIIAHRLSTVANTDMIVVMEHGQVVETGAPDALLADPNSRFSQMHHTGL